MRWKLKYLGNGYGNGITSTMYNKNRYIELLGNCFSLFDLYCCCVLFAEIYIIWKLTYALYTFRFVSLTF